MRPSVNETDRRLDFVTTRWSRNPHFQTCFPAVFSPEAKTPLVWEEFNLPDGDFLDLCWAGQSEGPVLIILHGLEGSVYSHYIQSSLDELVAQGWRVLVMHHRGCGRRINRLRRAYHSGDTQDLSRVIHLVKERYPASAIVAMGFSLGANILLKYVAEHCQTHGLKAVAAVSVPFELDKTADFVHSVYQLRLIRSLSRKLLTKLQMGHRYPITVEQIKALRTLRAFDTAITCDLYGFKDPDDYYAQSSCRPLLKRIDTPTLILHALDDPFIPANCVPEFSELSSACQLELTPYGGHVGFVSGMPWKPIFWLPHRVIRFFNEVL